MLAINNLPVSLRLLTDCKLERVAHRRFGTIKRHYAVKGRLRGNTMDTTSSGIKFHKGRLSFVFFVLIFGAWFAVSGKWSIIYKLPSTLRNHIHTADYDNYAKSIGTTRYKMAEEFYQNQVEHNRIAREKGQSACTWYGSGKDCYYPPVKGLLAIRPTINASEVLRGHLAHSFVYAAAFTAFSRLNHRCCSFGVCCPFSSGQLLALDFTKRLIYDVTMTPVRRRR